MTLRDTDSKKRLIWIVPFGLSLLIASGLNGQVPLQTQHSPAGWFLAGDNPTNYRTGVDRAEMHDGLPSAYLVSLANGTGFGTLMQSINAANYAGKRVRLRAWVESRDVSDWAGLWMRVDKGREAVTFDNMQDRPIKGTQSWNTYDVVLDVPADATNINFGILLTGAGEVWMNHVSLEVVDNSTPSTQTKPGAALPLRPANLGFNE